MKAGFLVVRPSRGVKRSEDLTEAYKGRGKTTVELFGAKILILRHPSPQKVNPTEDWAEMYMLYTKRDGLFTSILQTLPGFTGEVGDPPCSMYAGRDSLQSACRKRLRLCN